MGATITTRTDTTITVEIEIPLRGSMLEREEGIQAALNDAGRVATGEALQRFDGEGVPLTIGRTRWTSKGQEPKAYQTPYGEVVVARHVYQTAQGGPTYCPLEREARIVVTSTPLFAKQVSPKYAEMSAGRVVEDFAENHGRAVSRCFVQDVAEAVGSAAQAKEEDWEYATPKLAQPVATVGMGMDGTCMWLGDDGWREAMVGTISLYDRQGERQHTIYIGAAPEYGRAKFIARLEREIERVKAVYPRARMVGIADGAPENWRVLERHTETQVLDFYHVTGYLAKAAQAACPHSLADRTQWFAERCHQLKHEEGAAERVLAEMDGLAEQALRAPLRAELKEARTYFRNHHSQMHYAAYVAANLPIGSGVTEAACKTLIKQRLCGAGRKWKERGAGVVLSLRTLSYTPGRWEQFWAKIDRYGFPLAA